MASEVRPQPAIRHRAITGGKRMASAETERRVQAIDAFESLPSLDAHGELVRLILVEASLLVEKYRNVRRHDVPHIAELSGLLDVLWQEVEMAQAVPRGLLEVEQRPV
jgi:hypothetical protein